MSFDATPSPAPPAPPVDAAALLAEVRDTYERGRYLGAWRRAAPLGRLEAWPGAEGLVLAGRLANQLGDERRGALLHLRAHRLHPESGEAWLWAARVACERLGPWRGRTILGRGGPPGTPPEELLALRARLAADLRDFDEAERLLAEAVALAPGDPWTVLQPGVVQARADDHQGALATADRALALQPWFRPAVDFRAHTLLALGRDDEAAAWLQEALGHLEAASTCEVLLQLQLDRGEHAAAEATLARLEALTPLRSRAYEGWLEGRRSDVAYHLGDRPRAAAHARRSRNPFYLGLAERLEAAGATQRVVLAVPFVRQHHLTCAPATLSALCALHGVAATHLGIAEAICYHLLGDALWNTGARDESLHAYRFATCLERTNEHFADAYFRAARCLGRAEAALAFLRRQAVLERALARRPEDGALLLYATRAFALAGQPGRARALLSRARGPAHPVEVLRTEALLEELEGNLAPAAEARVRASELEPLNVGSAQAAARLLAETRDRAAAVAFLRGRVARFPHHVGLGRALVGWLDEEPPAAVEAELCRLVAAAPADAWAWRELALHRSHHGRLEEAFDALARAAAVEPDAPALQNVRATVLARAGRAEEARAALRASLRLEVDQEWAIDRLLGLASDAAGRAEELRLLHAELVRQVTFGDGLLAYQRHAAGVLPPEEVLATLREAHASRPDLWHAWVALGSQLVLLERTGEAEAHLGAATRRFPLLPRLWLELGLVHRAAGDAAGWRRMLERALELNPAWRDATFKLAELLQGAGEHEAARTLLARALRHAPSDGVLHGWLADVLLALGRGEEALEALQRALRLEPSYGWALDTLRREARRLGRPGLPGTLAEALVAERPLDARAWLLAARTRDDLPARLEAVDRALALSPLFTGAIALKVDLLAEAGRHDEALAAVSAPPWQGPPPRSLRLRVAQLEGQRGRAREARVALDELLAAEPDFLEGWEVAAEWHDAAGRHEDCLRAARQLVRLGPQRSTSLGWLGLALQACGDRPGAKEALARAVQLDPAYQWAVRRLLEQRVEDREWEGATELMVLVERHFEPGERHALRLRLEAGQRRWGEVAAALTALAEVGDARELEGAVQALAAAGEEGALEPLLAAPLGAPDAGRAAGLAWLAWARQRLAPGAIEARLLDGLARLGPRSPALAGAVKPWLETLGETGQRRRLLQVLDHHGGALAGDPELWGTAGYALTRCGAHGRAVAWLQASPPREGLEPWMLLNLGYSLCHGGRLAEGAAACRAALRLPADHTRARLEAVVALEAALRGDLGPAAALAEGEDLGRTYGCLAWQARALSAAAGAPGAAAGWGAAAPHLARAAGCSTVLQEPAFLKWLWLRTLARLAGRLGGGGGPSTAFWFLRGLGRALRGR